MADLPIPFSAPMILALLAGRKTQTRRLINPQPAPDVTSAGVFANNLEGVTNRWEWLSGDPRDCDTQEAKGSFRLPYRMGDRLYVRERIEEWKQPGAHGRGYVRYHADGKETFLHWPEQWQRDWAPPMHMLKEFSRLTLPVLDVRVERLQEISVDDAEAEGVRSIESSLHTYVARYRELWDSLHGLPGTRWADNPWLYAVTFDVQHGHIDRLNEKTVK